MLIIDIKSGVQQKTSHSMQMAAYISMALENYDAESKKLRFNKSIKFYPKSHLYYIDGTRILSVTQAINKNKKLSFLKEYADRGRYIHSCCDYDDLQKLDYDKLNDYFKGFVDAWRNFKFKYNIAPDSRRIIEYRQYSEIYNYCGTIDRIYPNIAEDKIIAMNIYIKEDGSFQDIIRCDKEEYDKYLSKFLERLRDEQLKFYKGEKHAV